MSSSDDSDSSPDSGFLYLASMQSFRLKRDYVRAEKIAGSRRKRVKITRMSKIDASDVSEWSDANNLERYRLTRTAMEWTECFLSNDIVLQGSYDCANLLRSTSCISSSPVVVEADAFFPYCSETELVLNGYVVDEVVRDKVWIVHLSHRRSRQVTLEAGSVYLIGNPHKNRRSAFCHLCRNAHSLNKTPCPKVLRFMPVPSHAHFKARIDDQYQKGARVLTVIPGEPSQLACSLADDDLCATCLRKALKDRGIWFKMNGSCTDRHCPNVDWCECDEELEQDSGACAHYIYISEGKYNNLPDDDLADAVANGLVRTVTGCVESDRRLGTSRSLRKFAKKWLRKQVKVSIEHLLKEFSVQLYPLLKCEVMAMAMIDTRIADMIEGYKSFTLNTGIVTGFVENSEMMAVGPWLEGRLARDSEGTWWQTCRGEPILVSTESDVSTVCKASIDSIGPSDELGRWIA